MSSCAVETKRRWECHKLYGKLGEDCLVEELQEKRCLSFQHCPAEAQAYYLTKNGEKGICASWAEAFCFARSSMIDDEGGSKERHISSRDRVNSNRRLKKECRQVALDLVKCLKNKRR